MTSWKKQNQGKKDQRLEWEKIFVRQISDKLIRD